MISHTFAWYQQRASETAQYPVIGGGIVYPTLGLVGESGEVAEKVKKIFRDKSGEISIDDREELIKELGDVLWYVTAIANELGTTLHAVALKNIDKLSSRKDRNMLNGSGDNR